MTLGFTNGSTNYGTYYLGITNSFRGIQAARNFYGDSLGVTETPSGFPANNYTLGITIDPAKSGLTAYFNDLDIGTVNTLKLGRYILKY